MECITTTTTVDSGQNCAKIGLNAKIEGLRNSTEHYSQQKTGKDSANQEDTCIILSSNIIQNNPLGFQLTLKQFLKTPFFAPNPIKNSCTVE